MSTILPGLDTTNRLVEAVGSAALFQDVAAASPVGQLGGGLDLLGAVADADGVSTATTQTTIDPLALGGLLGNGLPDVLDVANLGDIVSGPMGSLPILAGLGGIAQPIAEPLSLLGSLTGGSGNGLPGNLDLANLGGTVNGLISGVLGGTGTDSSALQLVGPGATAQPVIEPVNQAITDFHHQLFDLGQQVGLPDVVHSVIHLGETVGLGFIGVSGLTGGSNLVTDTLNLPSNVLNGNLDGSLQSVSHDLTDTVNAVDKLITSVLHGPDPTNPIPELIQSVGQAVQTLPLLTVNGGNNSGDGGIVGALIGDIAHSNSGHLIDLDIGPSQSGGIPINLLSTGDSNGHTVSLNVLDVGSNGPHLLDAGLLTGSGLAAPLSIAGTGLLGSGSGATDGLLGSLSGGTATGGLLGSLGGSHLADGLLGSLTGGNGSSALPDVAHIVPAGLPLPAITDVAGIAGGHGILDLHAVHII